MSVHIQVRTELDTGRVVLDVNAGDIEVKMSPEYAVKVASALTGWTSR
jgi:hypothetical protein